MYWLKITHGYGLPVKKLCVFSWRVVVCHSTYCVANLSDYCKRDISMMQLC